MKLLSLSIKNYKSFRNHNRIEFNDNINVVLGKNGSGKSNLLSALYEIFNFLTTNTNKTFNNNEEESFIEVDIENSNKVINIDSNVIKIRKVFNNSTNTYFLNSKSITLNELKLFFMDDLKYSFMEQSQSNISLNNLIEDISHITTFNNTINNISSTTTNIDDSLTNMLTKLDYKRMKYNEYAKRLTDFNILSERKKEIEHMLLIEEIGRINAEIESKYSDQLKESNQNSQSNQLLEEVKLEEIRNNIINLLKDKQKMEFISGRITNNKNNKELEERYNQLNEESIILTDKHNQLITKLNAAKVEQQAINYLESDKDLRDLKDKNINSNSKEQLTNQLTNKLNTLKNNSITISTRKEHFNKINSLSSNITNLTNKHKILSNRLMYSVDNNSNIHNINTYHSIKDIKGVIGIVYDLIDVDEKFIVALEAVAQNKLSYIVVDDKTVIENIKNNNNFSNKRVTFISLEDLKDNSSNLLSNNIKIKDDLINIRNIDRLISFLCGNFILCSNINSKSLSINNKYVTLDGDIISQFIQGGYSTKNGTMSEILKISNQLSKSKKELINLQEQTHLLDIELNSINKEAYMKYLEWKIMILTNKNININNSNSKNINSINTQILSVQSQISSITNQLNKIKNSGELRGILLRNKINQIVEEIKEKRKEESEIITNLFNCKDINSKDIKNNSNKNILLEKRSRLMKEGGITSFKNLKRLTSDTIIKLKEELSTVIKNIRPYVAYNFSSNAVKNNNLLDIDSVIGVLNKLKKDKESIDGYANKINESKEDIKKEIQERITKKYEEIFDRISSKKDKEDMHNDRNIIDKNTNILDKSTSLLSGGQQTIHNICLLLVVQDILFNNKSFLVLDEVDAALDSTHCSRLYGEIMNSNSQIIFTTFKKEYVENKNINYYEVRVNERKESEVRKISREEIEGYLVS